MADVEILPELRRKGGERMNATDELRRLFDERSISYINVESIDGSYWGIRWFVGNNISAEWRENGERHELLAVNIAPEQAIAATLESGTCMVESKIFIEGEYVPCPYFEYEMGCGGQFRWDEAEPPNYCPNCGAKVVGE